MKKIIIFCIVLMGCLVCALAFSTEAIAAIGEDGFAMPESSGIQQSLHAGEKGEGSLVSVNYEDTVYSSLLGYYVGENRIAIDTTYPIYVNGGAGLRFLDAETWLFSTDVMLLRTFEGLYLSDGTTYNKDMSQADLEEFILLVLSNGLYMNAQDAVFTNRLGSTEIPANSIIYFSEDALRWYVQDRGYLVYDEEESVFDATITIGSNTYNYADLLEALGLLQEAIERIDNGKDPGEIFEDIGEIILGGSEDGGGGGDGANTSDDPKDPEDDNQTGDDGSGSGQGDVSGPGEVPGEGTPGGSGSGSNPGGDSSADDSGNGGGSGSGDDGSGTPDGENASGESGNNDPDSSTGNNTGDGADGGDDPGDDTPGSDDGGSTGAEGTEPGSGGGEVPGSGTGEGADPGSDTGSGDDDDDDDDDDNSGGAGGGLGGGIGGGFGGGAGGGAGSGAGGGAGGGGGGSGSGSGSGDGSGTGEGTGEGTGSGSGTGGGEGTGSSDGSGSGDGSGAGSGSGEGTGGGSGGGTGAGSGTTSGTGSGSGSGSSVGSGEGTGEGSGETGYRDPEVTLTNLQTWWYAFSGRLLIDDPANTTRSVRVGVYSEIDGSGATSRNEEGFTVYPADKYTAVSSSSLMRKSYRSTQDIVLGTFEPGSTVYVQFTYTYNKQIPTGTYDEEGREIIDIKRTEVISDLIEIKLEGESALAPISLQWNEVFAAEDRNFSLENLTLGNTTDYVADLEVFDFDNYQKNTAGVVSYLQFTLTPENGGAPITVNAPNSTVRAAQKVGGTLFVSAGGKLTPNTGYDYTVTAYDAFGNEIPIQQPIRGYTGKLYTSKTAPVVTIEQLENVTDKLTLTVTVTDKYGALADGEPLALTIEDRNNVAAGLYGKWEDGSAFGSADTTQLLLEDPADGKRYTFTVESLPFSVSYTIRVRGDYSLQPTGVTQPSLPAVEDAVLGSSRCYTAALSSGSIHFSVTTPEVNDTWAIVGFTMTRNSTIEILNMVDEFRFSVKDPGGNAVASVTLAMSELSDPAIDHYDPATGTILLDAGSPVAPTVELVGLEDQVIGKTLWETLLVSMQEGEDGEAEYYTPMQLRVTLPRGTLTTSTRYSLNMESVVIKSGKEYPIPTTLSSTAFTTKKVQPVVNYEEFLVAADIAQLIDLQIYDPNGTIMSDGLVYARLYYITDSGSTLINEQKIYATAEENSGIADLTFEGIVSGGKYAIELIAATYNDTSNPGNNRSNYHLWSREFEGSSLLSGSLTLKSLETTSTILDATPWEEGSFTPEEVAAGIESGQWTLYSSDRYYTPWLDIPEGATFLRVDTALSGLHSCYVYYKDAQGSYIRATSVDSHYQALSVSQSLLYVPEGAVEVRFLLVESVAETGLSISSYSVEPVDLLAGIDLAAAERVEKTYLNSNGAAAANSGFDYVDVKFPVTPGSVLSPSYHTRFVHFWTEDGGFLTSVLGGSTESALLIVPEGAAYASVTVSHSSSDAQLYEVAKGDTSKGYTAQVLASVRDEKGYLAAGGDTTARVELYRSPSVNQPVYDARPYKTWELPLTDGDGDGAWDLEQLLDGLNSLPANCGWKMDLWVNYQAGGVSRRVELDSITFQTDGTYIIISNQYELYGISRNPYANYLVVSDIEITEAVTNRAAITLHGTVDFQGHAVTFSIGKTRCLFDTVGVTGVIRNMVVEVAAGTEWSGDLIYQNRGLVENLIVRTGGPVNATYGNDSMLVTLNHGTLRNFILELGGDLYITPSTASTYPAVLVYYNYGTGVVENGYLFGESADIIFSPLAGGYLGGLFNGQGNVGTIRNIYAVADVRFPESTYGANGDKCALANGTYGGMERVYYVGDYYLPDGQTRVTAERFWHASDAYVSAPTSKAVWHLSSNTYKQVAGSEMSQGAPGKLSDLQWQKEMLGDGFDVENCITSGFYPRLILPDCMARYQSYHALPPQATEDVPELVSDGMSEGYEQGNEWGMIRLYFRNPRRFAIKSVTIEGLTVTGEFPAQGVGEDGLYYVDVPVRAEAFLSRYQITGFTYSVGSGTAPGRCSYTTGNVEFWKEVSSLSDWRDINDHMDWNYRLTRDLDFGTGELLPGEIRINGSRSDINATGIFSGKLDGGIYDENGELTGLHSLKNISLLNLRYPSVIYRLKQGACLSNLLVENMTLSCAPNSADTNVYTGFVGRAEYSSLDNIHLRGCSAAGCGYVGLLEGSGGGQKIRNCSAVDCVLTDVASGYTLYGGGLVGYATGTVYSCYVARLKAEFVNSSSVRSVGGIVGFGASSFAAVNCYATGEMTVTGSYVGGIQGDGQNSNIERCWADVDLVVTGSNVGGISGEEPSYSARNLLAVGNLSVNGDLANVNRVNGITVDSGERRFAYAGQVVTGLEQGEAGDAKRLFEGRELAMPTTWLDQIEIGPGFSMDGVEEGFFPKIYRWGEDTLVWGQEDLTLPGLEGDHYLTIDETGVLDGKYTFNATWYHPGYTTAQLQEMLGLDEGSGFVDVEEGGVAIVLEGMRFDNDAISGGSAAITLDVDGGSDEVSHLSITTSEYLLALDSYRLTMDYGVNHIVAMVDYGEPIYHVIENLDQWNTIMPEQGYSGQNFLIAGKIDFGNGDTNITGLKLGRLDGKAGTGAGFFNLEYDGGAVGKPWFESISGGLRGLTFDNISANFRGVTSANKRAATGLFLSATGVENCKFTNIEVLGNNYTANAVGLFSTIVSHIRDVEVSNLNLLLTGGSNYSNTYAGALTARLVGSFENLKADRVTLSAPNTTYVGGVIGYMADANAPASVGGTFTNITLTGCYTGVGGVVYNGVNIQDIVVDGLDVTASGDVGGVAYTIAGNGNKNITVRNGTVKSTSTSANTYHAGGLAGKSTQWTYYYGVRVENLTVTGQDYVGGVMGYGDFAYMYNVVVEGCEIISTGTSASNTGAGGLYGHKVTRSAGTTTYVTVRNTTVTAENNAGGLVGMMEDAAFDRVYVAEDVVVTANKDGAGGLFGCATYPTVANFACGATVKANTNAGGLIGRLDWRSGSALELTQGYYRGDVYATVNNAGGLIGVVDGSTLLTETNLNGVLMAGNVATGGSKASLWANSGSTGALTAGDGKVYVWENAVLCGQTANTIREMGLLNGAETYLVPAAGKLITAGDFRNKNTYTGLGFTDQAFSYSLLSTHLPIPKDASGELPLSRVDADGNPAGILQPELGEAVTDETAIYASGVNTVNIEVGSGGAANVTVNGVSYTTDDQGVLTLSYDFQTDLEVSTGGSVVITMTAEDLLRSVMTWNGYWYYINDAGQVCWGTGEQASAKPTVTLAGNPLEKIIHLWQGKAMDESGKVYSFTGGTAAEVTADKVSGIAQKDSVPFWTTSVTKDGNQIPIKVYHDFSLYGAIRTENRLFVMDGKVYAVATGQGTVYDGVILSIYDDKVNEPKRYFALLKQDGSIISYQTAWPTQNFDTQGIDHISNNLGYDANIVLARYEDGTVAGYNYRSGKLLFSTRTMAGNFLAYARNQLFSLFSFGRGNAVTTDESFMLSEDGLATGTDELTGAGSDTTGVGAFGENTENGTADGETGIPGGQGSGISGETGNPGGDGEGDDSRNNGSGTGGGSSSASGAGGADGAGTNADGSGSDTAGGSVPGGGAAADSESGQQDTNADGAASGGGMDDTQTSGDGESGNDAGNDAGQDGSKPSSGTDGEDDIQPGSGSSENGQPASGTDVEVPDSGIFYVPGEGVYEDGVLVLAQEELTYKEGEGVYADDELLYGESLEADAEGEPESGGELIELLTREELEEILLNSLADGMVTYDPIIGSYTATEGAVVLGMKERYSDSGHDETQELGAQEDDADAQNGLVIGQGFGRQLSGEERGGFALLGVLAVAGVVILVLLYAKVIRKKR